MVLLNCMVQRLRCLKLKIFHLFQRNEYRKEINLIEFDVILIRIYDLIPKLEMNRSCIPEYGNFSVLSEITKNHRHIKSKSRVCWMKINVAWNHSVSRYILYCCCCNVSFVLQYILMNVMFRIHTQLPNVRIWIQKKNHL